MKRHPVLAATVVLLSLAVQPSRAADAQADIGETYGTMPGFFRLFPAEELGEIWEAFTALQINPDIGMEPAARELVGVAVAAGSTCGTCLYFHVAAARAAGVTEAEILDAIGVVIATKRLHAALALAGPEPDRFRHETDLVLWGDAQAAKGNAPSPELWRAIEGMVVP